MVQKPPRRRNEDVHTLGEALGLRPAVCPTHDETVCLAVLALGDNVFANTIDLPEFWVEESKRSDEVECSQSLNSLKTKAKLN